MAKRKTIGENPLDAVPDRTARHQEETSAATNPRPASAAIKFEKGTATSVQTTRTQSPPPQDLLSRIQSLEEQNEYIKWLVGGAILLAVLL
jgi:hypothetical protein